MATPTEAVTGVRMITLSEIAATTRTVWQELHAEEVGALAQRSRYSGS